MISDAEDVPLNLEKYILKLMKMIRMNVELGSGGGAFGLIALLQN